MDFLVFTVNKQQYGVRIDEMIAIQPLPNITSVPGSPEAVKGIFAFHGELIPVIDLSLMYQGESVQNPRFIVIAKGKTKYAVLVDCIGSIVRNELPDDALLLGVADVEQSAKIFNSNNVSSTVELF